MQQQALGWCLAEACLLRPDIALSTQGNDGYGMGMYLETPACADAGQHTCCIVHKHPGGIMRAIQAESST